MSTGVESAATSSARPLPCRSHRFTATRDATMPMPTSSRAKPPLYEPRAEHCASPVAFARDVLGVSLWSRQEQVLEALKDNTRVAVKSGNGLGKGFSASVAILWFLVCHDPAVVLSTAPTFRQVRHVLWREVHRRYRNANYSLGGKLLDTRLEMSDARFALGLSADRDEEFQGFHSPNMLIVVDEAEGVEETIYEAIEAVMTSENCRLLLIGNPTTMGGTFRRAFYEDRELYSTMTISALESPNIVEGRVVHRGLATQKWVEERRSVWGEENPIFRARVLGEFPDQGEDTLVALSQVEAAAGRHAGAEEPGGETASDDAQEPVILAVDVARFGSDKSVILKRRGMAVEEIQTFRGLDTMKLTGRIVDAIKAWDPDQVLIDEVGIGAGVVDRLRELGHRVRGVNVGKPARDTEHYANLRAEGYWTLRQLFAEGKVSIPADNDLVGQVAGLRYSFNSLGQVVMESKDEMRRRGVSSPDKADALMLAFLADRRKLKFWA